MNITLSRSFLSTRFGLFIFASTLLLLPQFVFADTPTQAEILERLMKLESKQAKLESLLTKKDQEINELKGELERVRTVEPKTVQPTNAPVVDSGNVLSSSDAAPDADFHFGELNPGRGFQVADTPMGSLNLGAFTYFRYLNQENLDDDYTDAFGRTRNVDIRNDFQLQKVMLQGAGWIYDPNFTYLLYTWTANTSQGLGAQVVVAGNLSYKFDDAFRLYGGVGALPTGRSNMGSFPYWLAVDKRTMADEFHRGSYTQGIWADGTIAEGLEYRVMMGNNLSNLGVDAAQLDGSPSTYSAALTWMPTTGEFGPNRSYGDFEEHQELATLFGLHYTRSDENFQSQPDSDVPENSQLRLSDGTLLFGFNSFGDGTQVVDATYQMASFNAGLKYKGFSFDTAYFSRWIDDIKGRGPIPVDDLFDHGFEVQTSYMLLPEELQGYLFGSKIFGEYGDPYDAGFGFNYFPFTGNRNVRWNLEYLYLADSATGNISVPLVVGGDGSVIHSSLVLKY